MLFGSCIDETATEKSDIDILVVSSALDRIDKERKKVEELFGERLNLHYCTKEEIMGKMKVDPFIRNALVKGVMLSGYDLGIELFSSLGSERTGVGVEDLRRLLFFVERIKSSLRNYLKNDYETAEEIVQKTIEQLVFYLLSEKGITYTSKKDSQKLIKRFPEAKVIRKINGSSLKEKITVSGKFVMYLLANKILEEEGYAQE